MKRIMVLAASVIIANGILQSQTIVNPNYGLKSHETLEINKIEVTPQSTVFYLTVENRIPDGNFCADPNIFIIYPDGTRIKLISSAGIPVCPETYKFKSNGEKLDFKLTFSSLKPGTEWIDLVEECNDNCFSFYGVTLNDTLNKRLNETFSKASAGGLPGNNIILFKSILDSIDSQNLGIEGLLYINIISAAVEGADPVNAKAWYNRLASSHAPRVSQYLKYLNDKGIKY